MLLSRERLRETGPNSPVSRIVRMLAASIWLVYLVLPLRSAIGHGHTVLYSTGAVVLAVIFTGIYLFLTAIAAPVWTGPRRVTEVVFGLGFVMAVVTTIIYGAVEITMMLFVAASASWAIRDQRRALAALLVTIATYLVLGVTSHLDTKNYLTLLLPMILAGVAGIAIRRRMAATQQLMQAREEVERMAAAAERLRLARDLHDLTGQSLSTITLKSELAARLLSRIPEGADRDRALDEITQVAEVSRQTLCDIRQAISGYRRPTLAVEVITARGALESAGITPHDEPELTLASGTFGPDEEAALAWCLREAVTNVVRHSGARNCRIRLARDTSASTFALTVRDDGTGFRADFGADFGTGFRADFRAAQAAQAAFRAAQADGCATHTPIATSMAHPSRPAARTTGAAVVAESARAAEAAGVTRATGVIGSAGSAGAAGVAGIVGGGAGLRGMSERLCAVGGHLELMPSSEGFALTATVPAGKRVTVAS